MNLILLGAPGAGKGTQAEILTKELDIPSISTGNLIRAAMKNGTPAGLAAKSHVESGGLVPDDIVIEMLRERIAADDCKNGFILDGFPRTVPQAQALDNMGIIIDRVIDIEVDDGLIESRLSGRRVCAACGATYHVHNMPPQKADECDSCGGALSMRKDDLPETVGERLRVYHEQTEPLKDYYNAVGKLFVVEGHKGVEETSKMALAALEA